MAYEAILSTPSALEMMEIAAMTVGHDGLVREYNHHASKIFDDDFFVHEGRVIAADQQSRTKLSQLTDRLRLASANQETVKWQVIVGRGERRPIVIDAVVRGSTGRQPRQHCALLFLTDLDEIPIIPQSSLMDVFGLTPAQSRLASLLGQGKSLDDIAREMGISSGTARNHLKAVFARTDTRRQGELVALLSRLL